MRIISLALLAAFVGGCAYQAPRQGAGENLVLWPATEGTTLVGLTHDDQQPWREGELTLGDERRVSLSKNENDELVFRWRNTWWSGVRFDLSRPANLEPFRESGGIVLDMRLEQYRNSGFDIAWLCGGGCERKVTVTQQMAPLQGEGPITVKLPAHCLIRDQDTAGYVESPLRLSTGGTGSAVIQSARWEKNIDRVRGQTLDCPDYRTVALEPAPLNEHWAQSWWMPRHHEKVAKAQSGEPELVFLGDSITQGWENAGAGVFREYYGDYNTLNLGFGGDRTENVLWRLQHGEVDGIDPKLVVLMIGTNNTGHRQDSPALVAKGIENILQQLQQRLPETKVLMLAIFPRGAEPDDVLRQNNALINARIRNFADGEIIFFKDINSVFLAEHGLLTKKVMPDLLHPEEYGYRLWAEAIEADIEKLMAP